MKKDNSVKMFIVAIVLACLLLVMSAFSGCGNKQLFDTTYTFDKAIISLPDGTVIEGDVDSWKDYEDGDQIQVKIDGKAYLVHSTNIALIAE